MKVFHEIWYHTIGRDVLSNKKHCHNDVYEIIQCFSDNGTFLIKDKLYPLSKGAIYIINAIHLHASNPTDLATYERSKLILSRSYLDNLLQTTGLNEILSFITEQGGAYIPLDDQTATHIDEIYYLINSIYHSDEKFKKAEISILIIRLFMYVLLNHVIVINSADSTISRALQYINENITNNISLEDVAAYACVTKYHLCRMFRKKNQSDDYGIYSRTQNIYRKGKTHIRENTN